MPERNPPPLPASGHPWTRPTRSRKTSRCTSSRTSKTASPPESLLHGELEAKIEQALAELPENQRLAILLCRQDELSYEEIAKVLGCSVSATKSLIHRGRETLKQKLKPYLRTRRLARAEMNATLWTRRF